MTVAGNVNDQLQPLAGRPGPAPQRDLEPAPVRVVTVSSAVTVNDPRTSNHPSRTVTLDYLLWNIEEGSWELFVSESKRILTDFGVRAYQSKKHTNRGVLRCRHGSTLYRKPNYRGVRTKLSLKTNCPFRINGKIIIMISGDIKLLIMIVSVIDLPLSYTVYTCHGCNSVAGRAYHNVQLPIQP